MPIMRPVLITAAALLTAATIFATGFQLGLLVSVPADPLYVDPKEGK